MCADGGGGRGLWRVPGANFLKGEGKEANGDRARGRGKNGPCPDEENSP